MFVDLIRFVRLLTIEPFLFLYLIAHVVQKFPHDQLIQDKLCIQKYGLSVEYCVALPKMPVEADVEGQKSAILADVTQLNQMIIMVITGPTVAICLFIGHFIDQHRSGKRIVILLSVVVINLETVLLFLNSFFFTWHYNYILAVKLLQGLVGYPLALYAAIWSYTLTVTPVQFRAIRTTIMMALIYGATPIGLMLAGMNLNQDPLFVGHEIRNYSTVYFIAMGCGLLALIAALLLVDERRDRELYSQYFLVTPDEDGGEKDVEEKGQNEEKDPMVLDIENVIVNDGDGDSVDGFKQNLVHKPHPPKQKVWKLLFDLENVRQMSATFFKCRPHQIRQQLHLSIAAICLYVLSKLAMEMFGYQYVERVFNWDTKEFGLFLTLSYTVNIVTSVLFAPVILKVFQISDLTMSLIALTLVTMQNLIRSISTQLWIFELSISCYSLNLLTTVGFRSYISKIIQPNELGSIFGMLSVLEALTPLISSLILSNVFRWTIDTVPTFSFAIAAIISGSGLVCCFIVRKNSGQILQTLNKQT